MSNQSVVKNVEKLEVPTIMKAAVMTKPHEIELQEIAVPKVEGNEVLVKVMAVGVCGV